MSRDSVRWGEPLPVPVPVRVDSQMPTTENAMGGSLDHRLDQTPPNLTHTYDQLPREHRQDRPLRPRSFSENRRVLPLRIHPPVEQADDLPVAEADVSSGEDGGRFPRHGPAKLDARPWEQHDPRSGPTPPSKSPKHWTPWAGHTAQLTQAQPSSSSTLGLAELPPPPPPSHSPMHRERINFMKRWRSPPPPPPLTKSSGGIAADKKPVWSGEPEQARHTASSVASYPTIASSSLVDHNKANNMEVLSAPHTRQSIVRSRGGMGPRPKSAGSMQGGMSRWTKNDPTRLGQDQNNVSPEAASSASLHAESIHSSSSSADRSYKQWWSRHRPRGSAGSLGALAANMVSSRSRSRDTTLQRHKVLSDDSHGQLVQSPEQLISASSRGNASSVSAYDASADLNAPPSREIGGPDAGPSGHLLPWVGLHGRRRSRSVGGSVYSELSLLDSGTGNQARKTAMADDRSTVDSTFERTLQGPSESKASHRESVQSTITFPRAFSAPAQREEALASEWDQEFPGGGVALPPSTNGQRTPSTAETASTASRRGFALPSLRRWRKEKSRQRASDLQAEQRIHEAEDEIALEERLERVHQEQGNVLATVRIEEFVEQHAHAGASHDRSVAQRPRSGDYFGHVRHLAASHDDAAEMALGSSLMLPELTQIRQLDINDMHLLDEWIDRAGGDGRGSALGPGGKASSECMEELNSQHDHDAGRSNLTWLYRRRSNELPAPPSPQRQRVPSPSSPKATYGPAQVGTMDAAQHSDSLPSPPPPTPPSHSPQQHHYLSTPLPGDGVPVHPLMRRTHVLQVDGGH